MKCYIVPILLILLNLIACDSPEPGPISDAGVEIPENDPIWGASPGGDAGVPEPQDAGSAAPIPEGCDADSDGYAASSCGGPDCDDTNARIHPDALEKCSFEDENCNGSNNESLDCTFIAAGPDDLYRVDPFEPRVTWLFTVDHQNVEGGMLDIDTDPDGNLIAVKKSGMYVVDESGGDFALESVGQFLDAEGASVDLSTWTNGMAINSAGTVFLTNSEQDRTVSPYVSEAEAHTVNRASGRISLLGSLAPYVSSGDCVALKDDSILMTARDPADVDANDTLVRVDSTTAQTTLLGSTGFTRIFGLSASFDYLFGVTEDAKLLLMDEATGGSTLLLDCSLENNAACPEPPPGENSIRFWGAANGD